MLYITDTKHLGFPTKMVKLHYYPEGIPLPTRQISLYNKYSRKCHLFFLCF